MKHGPQRAITQSGFTLPAAVFLVVVVALLVAFMTGIATVQQAGTTMSLVGSRVFFAAQSGAEWGAARVLRDDSCFASPASFGVTADIAVSIVCAESDYVEASDPGYKVFELRATAARGAPGGEDYFQRELNVTVTSAP